MEVLPPTAAHSVSADGLRPDARAEGAVVQHAMEFAAAQKNLRRSELEQRLYERSGLLGVSGISSDTRTRLTSTDPRAREAVELFVFGATRETGAVVGSPGGPDVFVFAAGIGEHAAEIRAAICERLRWLGLVLDLVANARHASRISTPRSRVEVGMIPTDEEVMTAQHTLEMLRAAPHPICIKKQNTRRAILVPGVPPLSENSRVAKRRRMLTVPERGTHRACSGVVERAALSDWNR